MCAARFTMQLCMRVVSAMIRDSIEANDGQFADTHKYAILYSHTGATFSYRLDDVSRENIK